MKVPESPEITVLMPVYNSRQYVGEAIESILMQTYRDFEFLIINDGSGDDSESIILSYKDPRIRYLKNDRNIGLPDTLNIGINSARGTYIARMDADDISLPDRLEKQVCFMNAHPEVGVCGTAYRYFGDSTTVQTLPSDYRQAFSHLSFTSALGHPTCMMRKDLLDEHHLRYENQYEYAADYALWLKISRLARITSLPEVLLLYRWHNDNMSRYDPTRNRARGRVRSLWYEYVTGKPTDDRVDCYLANQAISLGNFRLVRKLLLDVLTREELPLLDKKYFAGINVTEYELELIRNYPLAGVVITLADQKIHRWSQITRRGLALFFFRNIKARLLPTRKKPGS